MTFLFKVTFFLIKNYNYSYKFALMTENLTKRDTKRRSIFRQQLLIENASIFISTLIFSKLILFTRYPFLNIPIKFTLLYAYSATLDPLVVFSGYKFTRFI